MIYYEKEIIHKNSNNNNNNTLYSLTWNRKKQGKKTRELLSISLAGSKSLAIIRKGRKYCAFVEGRKVTNG